jgi:hypothetical protein
MWLSEIYKPTSRYTKYLRDHRFIYEVLPAAQLWWVEKSTCDLLAVSAPTIPDDLTFNWKDVPTPCGFAVFEQDLLGTDAEIPGKEVRVSAIHWGPVTIPPEGASKLEEGKWLSQDGTPGRVGLGIGIWHRSSLDNGLDAISMERHANMFGLLTEDIGLAMREPHAMTGNIFTYLGRTDWINGRLVTEMTPGAPRFSPAAQQSMIEDRKLLSALWAITRTPVVSLVHEPMPREIARRSTRKGYRADVQVMTLRGPRLDQPTSGEGRGREWHHSWVVSPHWRWQAYGPQRSLRRLTLIPAYRKGDPTKPLLGGERVWRVVPPQGVS